MAATAPDTTEEQTQGFHNFLDFVLNPPFLKSFHGKLQGGTIQLQIFNRSTRTFENHTLRGIYPFMTMYEIKLAIYNLMEQADKALPEFTFLGRAVPPGVKVTTTDYAWNFPATPTEPVNIVSPAQLVKAATPLDSRFVESSGERRIIGITDRERVTLDDMFLKRLRSMPIFQVFFYEDLAAITDTPKPISERDWNGRFYPFFPKLSVGSVTPTAEQKAQAQRFLKAFLWRRKFYARLEELIDLEPLTPLKLTGIRYLRFIYAKPKAIPGVDAMFYDTPVTARRPYLRLLPAEASAISKLYLTKNGTPDLDDPRLLLQWSQERSPTPDRDFSVAKILYRKTSGNIPPLYLTLRLFDDGTADITIEPPRGVRKLDPRSELNELEPVLREGLQGLTYLREVPSLGSGVFIFGMSAKGPQSIYSAEALRKRLGLFKAVFQEIPALPGERPLLMIRYKLMSNFLSEDRIQSFITQVMNRKLVSGETGINDLARMVAEQFQLDPTEAKRRVLEKLKGSGDAILVDQESKDYIFHSNVGIDVAIFAQHPLYSFHIYRADSVENLQRIITFLSLLFSRDDKMVNVPEEAADLVDSTPVAPPEAKAEAEEKDEFKNVTEEAEGVEEAENDEFKNVTEEAGAAQVPAVQPAEEFASADIVPDYFQDMMFDVDAEPTIAELEGLPPPQKVPGALPEEASVRRDAAVEEAEEGGLADPFKDIKEDHDAVAEDAGIQAPVTKKPFQPKKKPAVAAATEPEPEPEEVRRPGKKKDKGFESFFSDKLMEADRRLFDYTRTHPSLKKYVSQCQANLIRQPAVLTQDQYERMLNEYRDVLDSGEITFYVFPLDKNKDKEPYAPKPGAEYYTLMKYGSSDQVKHYYLCSRYFCARDEILVREKEFLGTKLRRPIQQKDGSVRTTKPSMTCPFCEGRLIKDRRFPGVNETILERTIKPGTPDKRHLFINFLSKVYHPEGLRLPCCFTDDQPIRIGHPAFPEPAAAAPAAAPDMDEEEEEFVAAATEPEGDIVSYEETLLKAKFAYIVGAEKFPLEGPERRFGKVRGRSEELKGPPKVIPPQIGLLPQVLNDYFGQDSGQLVSRTFNPQKLRPGAQGFLRIGVENRVRYKADSFLAATAPFFGKNSVRSFKDFLADIIQPRIFLAMNFGNFALEMYDPATARPKPEEMGQVREWARKNLGIRKMTTNNEELVIRAFMSYRYFQGWLSSDQTTKEYRQFAHLFAQPGILQTGVQRVAETGAAVPEFRRPGILFVVLEILKSGELHVRCPPYPVSKEAFGRADIGFLLHHWSGVWEPLFYADNRSLDERDVTTFFLSFSNRIFYRWPKIIQQRIQEYAGQCATPGGARGIYTSGSVANTGHIATITATKAYLAEETGITLQGLIRDSYNHVAALVYNSPTSASCPHLIAVPVIEDGIAMIDTEVRLIMDWDDYEPAPIDIVVKFYRKYITLPKFPKSYVPRRARRSIGTGQIVAIELANGLLIPVEPADDVPADVMLAEPVKEIDEMNWTINRELASIKVGAEAQEVPLGDERRLRMKEMNEVYEHLRLTFSNWLATQERGGEFRVAFEDTIFRRDLPLFEKRKRMEIMLSPIIESWLEESDERAPRQASLLRVDCRLRSQEECTGMCSWSRKGDQCLIHVPKTAQPEGEDLASGARVLLLRLIEELLRYAGKRQQIFEQRVSQLAVLDNPIRLKDQYIVPEKSAAWSDLLRLEWARDKTEEPRYLEEMARAPAAAAPAPGPTAEPFAPIDPLTELPETLKTILGASDPKVARLRLYPSPTETLEPFLRIANVRSEDIGLQAATREFTDETLTAFVKKAQKPIVIYDLRPEEPYIDSKRLPDKYSATEFPVIVFRADVPPALLVTDPEAPAFLAEGDLPEKLVTEFKEAKVVWGVKKV